MKKKEVLPEGIFLNYECGRRAANPAKNTCSDDFVRDMSLGPISYLICGACHRVHFNSGVNTSLSPRRIRKLREQMKTDGPRYVEHSEPFNWLELRTFFRKDYPQRAVTTFECQCGFAKHYEIGRWNTGFRSDIKRPEGTISWSSDGKSVIATVQVNLPDSHIATREYQARLVSVECLWGTSKYQMFYLTDFSPKYKHLDIVEVGLNPVDATSLFAKEYFHRAGWDFAVRLLSRCGVRLTLDWSGKRHIPFSYSEPNRSIDGQVPNSSSEARQLILDRVQAQQSQRLMMSRAELSDEQEEILRQNREFQDGIEDMILSFELEQL